MIINIFKRINELGNKAATLRADFNLLRESVDAAHNLISELTDKIEVLERVNLYGRGNEPAVVIDYCPEPDHNPFGSVVWVKNRIMRLYIDGEEYTIRDVNGLGYRRHPILHKSITVDGDIAIVVIRLDEDYEHVYYIEYDKGTYVHQVRDIVKESEE